MKIYESNSYEDTQKIVQAVLCITEPLRNAVCIQRKCDSADDAHDAVFGKQDESRVVNEHRHGSYNFHYKR